MSESSLPDSIVESFAISNASSIAEQPAILANLALANQIFNNNIQQQIILTQQQVMNQLTMATLARCVSLINTSFPGTADSQEIIAALDGLNQCLETTKKIAEVSNAVMNGGNNAVMNGGSNASTRTNAASSVQDGAAGKPASTLPAELVEQVAAVNLNSVAVQPAMLSNLAYSNVVLNTNLAAQNAVANQQALNEAGVSVLGKTVNIVSNLGPVEAKAAQEILTGNTVAEQIADLKAALAAFNGGK
jgi:hypothetical protein